MFFLCLSVHLIFCCVFLVVRLFLLLSIYAVSCCSLVLLRVCFGDVVFLSFGFFFVLSSSLMFWNNQDKRNRGHRVQPVHYSHGENENNLHAIENYMDRNYWQPIFQGVYSEMKTSRRISYELFRSVGFLKTFHTRSNPLPKLGSVLQQNTKMFLFIYCVLCSINFLYPSNQYEICRTATNMEECEIGVKFGWVYRSVRVTSVLVREKGKLVTETFPQASQILKPRSVVCERSLPSRISASD